MKWQTLANLGWHVPDENDQTTSDEIFETYEIYNRISPDMEGVSESDITELLPIYMEIEAMSAEL